MSIASDRSEPSPQAVEELALIVSRIEAMVMARQLWERVLTVQDRKKLGDDIDVAYRKHGTAGMWERLRGVSRNRAIVEVGKRLGVLSEQDYEWLTRETGGSVDVEEVMSIAIMSGDLVLSERPRAAYWNREEILINWERFDVLWIFFWELARRAKGGGSVDRFTFGENAHTNVIANRKNRLINMEEFPDDLSAAIEPAGLGTQKLTLPCEQIHIFELDGLDTLREWFP